MKKNRTRNIDLLKIRPSKSKNKQKQIQKTFEKLKIKIKVNKLDNLTKRNIN